MLASSASACKRTLQDTETHARHTVPDILEIKEPEEGKNVNSRKLTLKIAHHKASYLSQSKRAERIQKSGSGSAVDSRESDLAAFYRRPCCRVVAKSPRQPGAGGGQISQQLRS